MKTKQPVKNIINQLTIAQTKRASQDIKKWRQALSAAESINPFPRKVLLYNLYSEILLDSHLHALCEKRKTSVINCPLLFLENGIENKEISDLINTDSFTHLLGYCLDAKLFGHSLIELSFENKKLTATLIPRKHVVSSHGLILKNENDFSGFSYREKPYSDYLLEIGEPASLGVLLQCCPLVIYKKAILGDMATNSELFGVPFRIAKYNRNDDSTKQLLENSLKDMGSSPFAVIPDSADFQMLSTNQQGAGEMFKSYISLLNSELSKNILLNNSSMEQPQGAAATSYSQAKIHSEGEKQIHDADKLYISKILSDKLAPMLQLQGFNVGNGKFVFRENEVIAKETKLDMDIRLVKELDLTVDQDYFYQTYDLPLPKKELKDIE
jgi:phage gp29-like protein